MAPEYKQYGNANMIAAIFDFDGTLVSTPVWHCLIRYQLRHGYNRLPTLAHLACHYPLYPLARLGLLSETGFRVLWAQHMPWVLRGMTVRQVEAMFCGLVESDLIHSIRPTVLERLRWHQRQQHEVILLSGTFQPLLDQFAHRLEVEHPVGMQPEVRNGRYTGRLAGCVCIGPGKVKRLQQYSEQAGLHFDAQTSYAYADSYTDEQILSFVGHAVAVSPDARLRQKAQSAGWEVLE